MDLSDVCQIVWNGLIRFGVIWINVNRFGIFVILNYRIFAPNFFNFNIIFAFSIFGNFVASRIFTFTFFYAMPQQAPVGKILNTSDQVEDVAHPLPGPVNMWEWPSNGSWWVYSNLVICVPPKIKSRFITTFPTPEGEVPITFSRSINGSASFVSMHKELVSQPCTTYCGIFQPYIFSGNERCSILVQLVSADWSVAEVDICLAAFLPNGVNSDGVGIFLR